MAEKLHMSVARMRAEVSEDEFVRWQIYFGRKVQRQQMAAAQAQSGR